MGTYFKVYLNSVNLRSISQGYKILEVTFEIVKFFGTTRSFLKTTEYLHRNEKYINKTEIQANTKTKHKKEELSSVI